MNDVSLHQFLVLYTWFPLAALLLLIGLIARFYQKFSGQQTYYWLYGVDAVLFGAMFVRYSSTGNIQGDIITHILAVISGSLLIFLTLLLYLRMMNNPGTDQTP